MCVWCASGTFRIDESHGRSRVFAQWVDHEDKVQVSSSFQVEFLACTRNFAQDSSKAYIASAHLEAFLGVIKLIIVIAM